MLLVLFLFVLVPLAELYFLIEVGSFIGALPTIGLSLLTAVVGGYLVRHQGFSTLLKVQATLDQGKSPAIEMLEGGLLLLAGLLLLLPGFVTDVVGFVILIPSMRRFVVARFLRRLDMRRDLVGGRAARERGQRVVEGEFQPQDNHPPKGGFNRN